MSNIEPRKIWECDCETATGPIWLADAGNLLFCDPAKGRIHHFDPARGEGGVLDVGGRPSFVVPTHDGQLLYGSERRLKLIDGDGEAGLEFAVDTSPRNRTGDGTVDGKGRLWFSVRDERGEEPVGGLFRYFDERMIPTLFDMVAPAGPAISADDRTLYHVDSTQRRISRFAINHAAALSNSQSFLSFDEAEGMPLAVALDAEECLWVGFGKPGCVRRYSPGGELLLTVEMPGASVTGLAFGGDGLTTSFATTKGALFAMEAPVSGRLVPAMKLSHGNNLGLVDDDDH